MNPEVAAEWHFPFFYHFSSFFQFLILSLWRVRSEFFIVHVALAIVNMPLHPPSNWLNVGIPWVVGVVSMTIIARHCHHFFHCVRHFIMLFDCIFRLR